MNPGTSGPTSATLEQQQIAMQQMQDFWKTQIPALNYTLKSSKQNEPALETMAAGQAAGAGRAAGTAAAVSGAASPRGTTVGNVGKGLYMGANDAAVAPTAARMGARGMYDQTQLGIVGQGNKILDMANKGLVTAGGVSEGEQQATQAADQARSQASASALAAIGAAFL